MEERKTLWYKAHEDDYLQPNFQKFLESCLKLKIPRLAAIGFIEVIRHAMIRPGKLTWREIYTLGAVDVFDVEFDGRKSRDWLALAIKFKILEEIREEENGESFVFYTERAVQEAYTRLAEIQKQRAQAGKRAAEKRQRDAENKARKAAKERERRLKKRNGINVPQTAERLVELSVERSVEQIKD